MEGFRIKKEDIKKLIEDKRACIVSHKIMLSDVKVGYMYREKPSDTFNDSGWRFFAGDETQEYCDNPDNFCIVELNTVCNYDASIIKKIDADIGVAFKRRKCGRLYKEKFDVK
jgi:hypothetical protein